MSADQASPFAPERFPALPAVRGVRAAAGRLGLYKHPRDDVIALEFGRETTVAGAFTTSATRSADVDWCRAALAASGGRARALIVNAGNSNAFTGAAGVAKNAATVASAAALTGAPADRIYLAATGVIAQPLAPHRVADALPKLWERLGAPDWEQLARAIMTTDTFPKGAGETVSLDGRDAAIAGFAKGSGMIAPNMATMLAFVMTDAAVAPGLAQALVKEATDRTFNAITVDGDTSTSDTLLLFATGESGGPSITSWDDPRRPVLAAAIERVMAELALLVVKDGEGASKLIRIEVTGAASDASARRIGLSIANSPLVKTAVAGGDANWGRVVMAVGKAGEPIERDRLAVRMGGVWTARDGGAIPFDAAAVDAHFAGREIEIGVDVGLGLGRAQVTTCDLTKRYIEINADYRS